VEVGMSLQLTSEELELLREVVNRELGNVKEEVYKTDSLEYKLQLRSREATIVAILSKLQSEPAPTA
jgi:hypothetical protein